VAGVSGLIHAVAGVPSVADVSADDIVIDVAGVPGIFSLL
jgi:hypothetical protein